VAQILPINFMNLFVSISKFYYSLLTEINSQPAVFITSLLPQEMILRQQLAKHLIDWLIDWSVFNVSTNTV